MLRQLRGSTADGSLSAWEAFSRACYWAISHPMGHPLSSPMAMLRWASPGNATRPGNIFDAMSLILTCRTVHTSSTGRRATLSTHNPLGWKIAEGDGSCREQPSVGLRDPGTGWRVKVHDTLRTSLCQSCLAHRLTEGPYNLQPSTATQPLKAARHGRARGHINLTSPTCLWRGPTSPIFRWCQHSRKMSFPGGLQECGLPSYPNVPFYESTSPDDDRRASRPSVPQRTGIGGESDRSETACKDHGLTVLFLGRDEAAAASGEGEWGNPGSDMTLWTRKIQCDLQKSTTRVQVGSRTTWYSIFKSLTNRQGRSFGRGALLFPSVVLVGKLPTDFRLSSIRPSPNQPRSRRLAAAML